MKYSSDYLATTKQEYFRHLANILVDVKDITADKYYENQIANSMVESINALSEGEYQGFLTQLNKGKLSNKYLKHFNKQTKNLINFLTIKYQTLVFKVWERGFDLGISHQIGDFLYNIPVFRDKMESPTKYTNFMNSTPLTAHFAKKKKSRVKPRTVKDITLFRRNRTTLRNNLQKLIKAGLYRTVSSSSDIAGRFTVLQRQLFLKEVEEISNFTKKAELIKKDYLSANYLKGRAAVLSRKYSRDKDKQIKDLIANYLKENISGVNQIRTKTKKAEAVQKEINKILSKGRGFSSAKDAGSRILRTEISFAYNLGKLAGFASPEDSNRVFKWQSDRELAASKPGYVICDYCQTMQRRADEGEVFTVEEILINAMSAGGIEQYKGTNGTKTEFKSLTKPQIPGHVNCSCYWVLVSDEEADRLRKIKRAKAIAKAVAVTGGFVLSSALIYSAFAKSVKAVSVAESIAATANTAKSTATNASYVDNVIFTADSIGKYKPELLSLFKDALSMTIS